jgi:flagellar biosynthesis/type III secretory pathway protein FliH
MSTFVTVLEIVQKKNPPLAQDKNAQLQARVGKVIALLEDVYNQGRNHGYQEGMKAGIQASLSALPKKSGFDHSLSEFLDSLFKPK